MSDELPPLTDQEMFDIMQRDDNPISKAWRTFRTETARLELKRQQRTPVGIIEYRHMELQAVIKILRAGGATIEAVEKN